MRAVAIALALMLVTGACARDEASAAVNPDLAEAAYHLCPVLWQWQLTMGATMNDMSHDAFREPDPDARLQLYFGAMDQARENLNHLRDQLESLPNDRFQRFFRREIENGLVEAEAAIDAAESSVEARYEAMVDPTYHEIVPSLFLAFEKVIDLAKPELASYGDPELIPSFQTVAQCQHGVKDADDGVPRYIPLRPEPTTGTSS